MKSYPRYEEDQSRSGSPFWLYLCQELLLLWPRMTILACKVAHLLGSLHLVDNVLWWIYTKEPWSCQSDLTCWSLWVCYSWFDFVYHSSMIFFLVLRSLIVCFSSVWRVYWDFLAEPTSMRCPLLWCILHRRVRRFGHFVQFCRLWFLWFAYDWPCPWISDAQSPIEPWSWRSSTFSQHLKICFNFFHCHFYRYLLVHY